MNNKNLSFGVFLLSLGVIWALVNLNIITWSVFGALFTLWPLFIVLVGINIIFKNNEIVKSLGWVALLTVLVLYGFYNQGRAETPIPRNGDKISIEKLAETSTGELRLDLGGLRLNMNSGAQNLLDAVVSDPFTKHSINMKRNNETAEIRFRRDGARVWDQSVFNQDCSLTLNSDVVWDMDINVGAVSGTLNLSDLKVKRVDLDTGAGDMKLVFGANHDLTDVKIDAGASRISVEVPENAGVKVKFDGGLNSNNLDSLGWERQGKNTYYSPGYNQAKSKINMDVDMGMGRFEIYVRR